MRCRAKRTRRTNFMLRSPSLPQNQLSSSQGINQSCEYTYIMPWLEPREPFPRFPYFLLLCSSAFPRLPTIPSRVLVPSSCCPYVAKLGTLGPFGLRLLYLGKITVDPCISQTRAAIRQIHLSLANTYYLKRLNFKA